MRSTLVTLPIALGISLLLGNEVLRLLAMSGKFAWLIPIGFIGTYLLYLRKPLDLLVVGTATLLAMPQSESLTRLGVSSDALVAFALSVMLLPQMLGLMGLEYSTVVKRID